MMNQSRAVAYCTLGRSDLLSMEIAERVRTAVTPDIIHFIIPKTDEDFFLLNYQM